jgi:sugar/nucleoside kinase (ribokinase family)
VKVGGVTQGERGVLWYDEDGTVQRMPAPPVPASRVRDTSGAGDVFHGSYVFSYLRHPDWPWREHLRFAGHAAAYKIQHLGNEAGLPTMDAVERVAREFAQPDEAPRPARANVAAMR